MTRSSRSGLSPTGPRLSAIEPHPLLVEIEATVEAERDRLQAPLADLAKDAYRAGAAEVELVNTRAEMDRLQRRGWLARLLNL